jgi:hypothetical protein
MLHQRTRRIVGDPVVIEQSVMGGPGARRVTLELALLVAIDCALFGGGRTLRDHLDAQAGARLDQVEGPEDVSDICVDLDDEPAPTEKGAVGHHM